MIFDQSWLNCGLSADLRTLCGLGEVVLSSFGAPRSRTQKELRRTRSGGPLASADVCRRPAADSASPGTSTATGRRAAGALLHASCFSRQWSCARRERVHRLARAALAVAQSHHAGRMAMHSSPTPRGRRGIAASARADRRARRAADRRSAVAGDAGCRREVPHLQPQQPAADRAAGRAAGHQPDPGRRVRHLEGAGPQRGQGVHRARGAGPVHLHAQEHRTAGTGGTVASPPRRRRGRRGSRPAGTPTGRPGRGCCAGSGSRTSSTSPRPRATRCPTSPRAADR